MGGDAEGRVKGIVVLLLHGMVLLWPKFSCA